MWSLVLLWLLGSNATSQVVPGFETELACNNAFNQLKDQVTWGIGVNLIGKCVYLKEAPLKQ
jgi:hypothetical protein